MATPFFKTFICISLSLLMGSISCSSKKLTVIPSVFFIPSDARELTPHNFVQVPGTSAFSKVRNDTTCLLLYDSTANAFNAQISIKNVRRGSWYLENAHRFADSVLIVSQSSLFYWQNLRLYFAVFGFDGRRINFKVYFHNIRRRDDQLFAVESINDDASLSADQKLRFFKLISPDWEEMLKEIQTNKHPVMKN